MLSLCILLDSELIIILIEWYTPDIMLERPEPASTFTPNENWNNRSLLNAFDQIDDSIILRVGGKATNLIILKRAGLPVPMGYCILTDAHDYYLEQNSLPDNLVSEIIRVKKNLGGKVAIRSSANCEDGTDLSMAGVFQSHYVYADEEIASVVEQIYKQSRSPEVDRFMKLHNRSSKDIKMGLIVQELVEPETAGVVYTGVNGENILVQYIDDFGAKLVEGETQGSAALINREGTIVESTGFETRPLSITEIAQLKKYSHIIEDLFPGIPQDIEFATKNGIVYLLQARTLTTDLGHVDLRETSEDVLEATKRKLKKLVAEEKRQLGTYTAIFSDANYSELLPRPTEMDIGTHMYVWGGSDGIPGAKQLGHAVMGYLVGDEAIGIIKFIGGRTYFSIARNAGVYHIGFPATKEEYFSTLVNEYLATVEKDPEKGSYPQMGLYLQDPTFEDLQIRFGERAHEYYRVYEKFVIRMRRFAQEYLLEFNTQRLPETRKFVEKLQKVNLDNMTSEQLAIHAIEILEHNRTKSYINFVRGSRLGFYYSQRLQNLLKIKLGVEKDEAQKLFARLNQGLEGSAITESNIAISGAASEEEALYIAEELVGHYSTGEMLEIRHKPMRDDPEKLLAYVRGIRQTGTYKEDFEKQKRARIAAQESILQRLPEDDRVEFSEVMHASQIYMAVRETAKYFLTKEYLFLRDTLELLGKKTGLENGDIYHLYPREIPLFASNSKAFLHLIRSRKQSFKNCPELDMPPVIRESEIESLSLLEKDNVPFDSAVGKFLAEGQQVIGVIVNSDEFDDLSEVNLVMQEYRQKGILVILAATQMNLSHDPLIHQSAGLVIKNAGLVAHGAQRARELGKGAIGGINTKKLRTGTKVLFDPQTRSVNKIND